MVAHARLLRNYVRNPAPGSTASSGPRDEQVRILTLGPATF